MADTDDAAREEVIFPVLSAPTEGRFTPTPYSFEFSGEDRLRLTVWSRFGVTVRVHVRVHRPHAPTHASVYSFDSTGTAVAETTEFVIGEGYLLNVTVVTEDSGLVLGQVFVRLSVIRGSGAASTVLGTIVQGYVTDEQELGWPGSPIADSLSHSGALLIGVVPDQIAGLDWSATVPDGVRWEILSAAGILTTSAAVANRIPRLFFTHPGPVTILVVPHQFQGVASSVLSYTWGQGLAGTLTAPGQGAIGVLPQNFPLLSGTTIATNTVGLQAGDQWTNIRMMIREWLEVRE
jgi:hypothetical protein